MFEAHTYVKRRARLKKDLGSGLVLFPGNDESPMNYPGNPYHFRQDSSFLYFFGLDYDGLFGVLDLDEDKETIFGYDFTVDDIVWMGPQPTLAEKCKRVGVDNSAAKEALAAVVSAAVKAGRKIHYLPQYRPENKIKLFNLLGTTPDDINKNASEEMIRAVVAQRELKTDAEIAEVESAIEVSYAMHTTAMYLCEPGLVEQEVSGIVEGIAKAGGSGLAFPIIFSTHGETLHNHYHGNVMHDGDLVVCDTGAEAHSHYASDLTRTIPVNGKFSEKQKAVYEIVLDANVSAIKAIKPGVLYRDIHMLSAKIIAQGMKDLGLMQGDVDEAVAAGAHALFFPHGLGHMMGLDVHDMENLGEDYVGYDHTVKRSEQFGTAYLRLAKKLQPGYVLTVEPGIYFIPELTDIWKAEKKHAQFINYEKVEEYRGLGGFRIEDDILVTETGSRLLGPPVPKTVADVEEECAKED